MREELKSYLVMAAGIADVPRQRALAAARALVSSGEATAEQVAGLAEDLLEQTRQNREAMTALVGFEVERALGRLGLASADDVTLLRRRVAELEAQLADATARPTRAAAPGSTSGPAKQTPVKAAPTATSGAATKPATQKAPAKKAPAKKAATKKAATKKAPANKSPVGATPTEKTATSPAAGTEPTVSSPAVPALPSDAVTATPASPA